MCDLDWNVERLRGKGRKGDLEWKERIIGEFEEGCRCKKGDSCTLCWQC
jgi:hypothetical protein